MKIYILSLILITPFLYSDSFLDNSNIYQTDKALIITHSLQIKKEPFIAALIKDPTFYTGIGASLTAGGVMAGLEYIAHTYYNANIHALPFAAFKIVSAATAGTLFTYLFKNKLPNKKFAYLCGLACGGLLLYPFSE